MIIKRGESLASGWIYDKVIKLSNCLVFQPALGQTIVANIVIKGNRIIASDLPADSVDIVIECDGLYVAPGFIDWQLNGAYGVDFSSDDDGKSLTVGVVEVARRIVEHGVTSFCPTVVTCPVDVYARNIPKFYPIEGGCNGGCNILSLHLEGPMLSHAKAGAHRKQFLQNPSLDIHEIYGIDSDCFMDNSRIGVVTIAAELPGATDIARILHSRGIAVSLGHSDCTVEIAEEFVAAGASAITHLFNAQSFLANRNPGVIGLLGSDVAERNIVAIGIITDGIHVHKNSIRMADCCCTSKLSLVTDAIALAGLPEGDHFVASQPVSTVGGKAVVTATGVLVGSIAFMDQCARYLKYSTGMSAGEAAWRGSEAASKLLHLYPRKGSLAANADADLILLDCEGNVIATIVGGYLVYCSSEW